MRIKYFVFFSVTFISSAVCASFDDAAKAYLLGNYEKARYEAMLAASEGSLEAEMLLGQMFQKGEGVEKDPAIAAYWYEKAVNDGLVLAQVQLGKMYYEGDGVEKNYNTAQKWLEKATQQGDYSARQLLENLIQDGSGNYVNISENLQVLIDAANKGNLKAQYTYGNKLLTGSGMNKDLPGAVNWLTKSAENGYIASQKTLGELYGQGLGVEKNYIEAYAWSMAYAGDKHPTRMYMDGRRVAKDALRNLNDADIQAAYVKSKEYQEKFVLPYHPTAKPVGPDDYRIVISKSTAKTATPAATAPGKTPATTPATTPAAIPATIPATTSGSTNKSSAKSQTPGSGAVAAGKTSDANKNEAAGTTDTEPPQAATTQLPDLPGDAQSVVDATEDAAESPVSVKPKSKRDLAGVKTVFDNHKDNIDAIYNNAWQTDKSLHGRVELELTIEPTGQVSSIKLISSELESEQFENQLLEYVKGMQFSNLDVQTTVILYALDFQPK